MAKSWSWAYRNGCKSATEISELYPGLNYNILYTAVTFHDIGDHIDRKNHEIIFCKHNDAR